MTLPSGYAFLRKALFVLIVLAAAVEFIAPLFVKTLASDGPAALKWIDAFAQQLRSGVLWPRWLPDSYAGLGSPTFYFYPPVAYYAAGMVRLFLPSTQVLTIYIISGYIATLASIASFYALSSQFTTDAKTRWASSLIYGFAPYHVFVLISRGGLSEHFAFIWPPLILLGLYRILRSEKPRAKDIALCSIAVALLVMTHLPSFVVVSIAVILPLLVIEWRNRNLAWAIGALCIGCLIAAPYLFPIIAFAKYVQLGRLSLDPERPFDALRGIAIIASGADFTENAQILIGYFGMVLCAIFLFIYLRRSKEQRSTLIAILAMCVTIIFFQNAAISRPLWLLLRLNQTVQFTYRWLIAGCLVVASAFAILSRRDAEHRIAPSIILWTSAAIFFALLQIFGLRAHPFNTPWTPYDPAEYAPASASGDRLEVIRFATEHANDPFLVTSDTTLTSLDLHPSGLMITDSISATHPTKVTLHHWYWPEWVASSEGKDTLTQLPDSNGRATLVLPAGHYRLKYALQTSSIEKLSYWVFGAGVLALLLTAILLRPKRRPGDSHKLRVIGDQC